MSEAYLVLHMKPLRRQVLIEDMQRQDAWQKMAMLLLYASISKLYTK